MVHTHCTHSWLGSFAARLIQLRPELHIGSAVQFAVTSFHHAAHIDPERAAEIFAAAVPAIEPSRGMHGARRAEPPAARYRTLFASQAASAAPSAGQV